MQTITGNILDASGNPETVFVSFQSQSTPQSQSNGLVIIANSTEFIQTNPSDGSFSITLEVGYYLVTIQSSPQQTSFTIAVVGTSGTVDIGTLITTPFQPLPGVPPNTVFNGQLAGNLTFLPIADPAAPTTAPEVFAGGHQTITDIFQYQVVWATALGVTNASPNSATSTGPTGSNNATRVTLPSPPPGVLVVEIYRSTNDSTLNRYLLATVTPSTSHYDDFESTADFNARLNPSATSSQFNSTAGGIFSSPAQLQLQVSDEGVFVYSNSVVNGPTTRLKAGRGLQLWNLTTGLWHTLICTGNPPTLAFDAGEYN